MKKFFLILLLMASAEAQGAASALAYGQRVVRAAEQIDRIKADSEYGDEGIAHIKELLPKSEDIETAGGTVKVDNNWLHALLDDYKAQKDDQQRLAKLNEAGGRLRALTEHVEAAEGAAESTTSREKIGEILRRSAFREKSENRLTALIKKIRNEIFMFLQDIVTRIYAAIYGAGTEASWLFRGIIIAGLVFALAMAIRMARRIRPKKGKSRRRTVLGEEIDEGTTAHDLAEAALSAARGGDFRLAVRKLYISLLYEMAEHNLVELEAAATNRDYLARVSKYTTLSSMMRYLTDRFEYFWYGMFSPTEEDFSAYHKTYQTGLESIRVLGEQTPRDSVGR